MLKKLKITNLAIVDCLSINFSDSFNIITGESGAGKTIIYKSISYLFGGRFNKNDLRKGEQKCELSGIVNIDGTDYELARVFTKGATKNYIDNKAMKLSDYIEFTNDIWESYGQHEQQLLIDESNHISYLDLFSKSSNMYEKYLLLYNDYILLKNEISELKRSSEDFINNKELYEFQFQELESIDMKLNEDIELQERISSFKKNKKSYETLYKLSNLNNSTSDSIKTVNESIDLMSDLSETSEDARNIATRLDQFLSEFEDIKFEASKLLQQFYYNQSEIDELSSRLISINELKRKYGGTVDSVIQHKNKLKLLLENSHDLDSLINEKNNQKNQIKEKLKVVGLKLFDNRKGATRRLSSQIKNDLEAMGMDKVDFFVDLGDFELNKIGIEKCAFYIRTNQGEELSTLGKIVSGGELSRIMMAIKLSINSCIERKLFILDEIDAGLSGKEADSIGNIIKTLSFKNQVICITHLSQIASKADRHFKIYKEVVADRTNCIAKTLDEKSKITELASMVSGQEITSESIDYAKGMLGK